MIRIEYDLTKCQLALIHRQLDQGDLSERGLSKPVISKFFSGKKVRRKTAAKIIKKLGLKWDDVATVIIIGNGQQQPTTEIHRNV